LTRIATGGHFIQEDEPALLAAAIGLLGENRQ